MRIGTDNVIYFLTVCGFFIGLMFCVLNVEDPFDILFYTLEITLFFYLLAHISIMNFIDVKNAGRDLFDYKNYEEASSYFINEIETREEVMESLIKQEPKKRMLRRKKKHDGTKKAA